MNIAKLRFVDDLGKEWPIGAAKEVVPCTPDGCSINVLVKTLNLENARQIPLETEGVLLGETRGFVEGEPSFPLEFGRFSLERRTFDARHKELTAAVLLFKDLSTSHLAREPLTPNAYEDLYQRGILRGL